MTPTLQSAQDFQYAYDTFNAELFGGELPQCLITLRRQTKCAGYFFKDRFVNEAGIKTDEIALNPQYFAITSPLEPLQTLVHEMVHLWQYRFGKPSRRTYHNAEWADTMERIGLMPSHTGQPGGNRVGQEMSDYALPGGRFEMVAKRLFASDFQIHWKDRFIPDRIVRHQTSFESATVFDQLSSAPGKPVVASELVFMPAKQRSNDRIKYQCDCQYNLWAKPNLRVRCEVCDRSFSPIETE